MDEWRHDSFELARVYLISQKTFGVCCKQWSFLEYSVFRNRYLREKQNYAKDFIPDESKQKIVL